MFGTLGVQEMVIIFLVALVLFGPKKLPELGKTIGKALTEFRRASNDLKATFDREMHTLERLRSDLQLGQRYRSLCALGAGSCGNRGHPSATGRIFAPCRRFRSCGRRISRNRTE
jgi:TatA/E family protein of Tat protein translocase